MSPISSRRLRWLVVASLLAMGAGCQRWIVVSVGLEGTFDPTQVSEVRSQVYELRPGAGRPRSIHDGRKAPDDEFMHALAVGIYLPTEVKHFGVQIDLYDLAGCPSLSAVGQFDLNNKDVRLVLNLLPSDQIAPLLLDPSNLVPGQCVRDAGTDADADTGATDGSTDRAEAPDLGADSEETATDTGECGSESPPVIDCFNPDDPDAGSAQPVTAVTSPECNGYCKDMGDYCTKTFTSSDTCQTVCTLAGWRLAGDGDIGMPLTCLANSATQAKFAAPPQREGVCINADVSYGACGFDCPTYCVLRDRLCDDHAPTLQACLDACSTFSKQRAARLSCFIQVLQHDVPGNRRYCNWTTLDTACGRCASIQ